MADSSQHPGSSRIGPAFVFQPNEIVHTRQVAQFSQRIDELRERYAFPEDWNDDIVEERFKDVPGFREAHEAETDTLYRASSEPDSVRKRALVGEALDMVRARQAEYFTGSHAVYRDLEELFLNMEGVAVWAAYELARTDPSYDSGIADRARNSWTQD